MERWRKLGIFSIAAMKAATFVAAWKIGGYCCVSNSPSSGDPYLGLEQEVGVVLVLGVYKKPTSWPVIGFRSGGRKVSGVCGIEKFRVLM